MKGILLRAGALGTALIAALAAPALAQDAAANLSPPAEKFAVAPGGVDMRSGRYAYSQTDLAIGGEAGALALTRTLTQAVMGHDNPFGNFSHNWDILLSEKRINVQQGIFHHTPGQPDYQIEVGFGGRSETFRSEGPSAGYEQTSRSGYASLTVSGSKDSASAVYTYTRGDGTVAVFRPIGSNDCSSLLRCAYVSQVTEADGTRLAFEYDNQGANATRLRSVVSNRGYALLFEYSGILVVKACVLNLTQTVKPADNVCPQGAPTATYSYAASKLAGATDASGATWGFTYSGGNMNYVRPGEGTPWMTNTIWERMNDDGLIEEIVTSQSFADGSGYSYSYDQTPPLACTGIPSIAGGSFTDNLGNTTTLRYDFPIRPYDPAQGHGQVPECDGDDPAPVIVHQVTPGPVEVTDPLGRITATDYCDPDAMAGYPPNWQHRCLVTPMPVSTTDPIGIQTRMTWDMSTRNLLQSRQIAVPGSGPSDIVRSATYNCTPATFRHCARPTSLTDARGAVTTYAYSADHGGLLTETGPAVNGVAPQTRHSYAQRHAWISNGGGYAQAATPVWVRVSTSACRTSAATGNPGAPCAAGALDEIRTTYDYGPDAGPNTLLLRGQAVTAESGGSLVTLRTCYGHDPLGRRISATQPNANLASCP